MNGTDPTPPLLPRVLNSELCVGCGICAGLTPSALQMTVTPRGEYQPRLREGHDWTEVPASVQAVCPFSGTGPDEDALGKDEFGGRPGMQPALADVVRSIRTARFWAQAGGAVLGTWAAAAAAVVMFASLGQGSGGYNAPMLVYALAATLVPSVAAFLAVAWGMQCHGQAAAAREPAVGGSGTREPS